MNKHVTYCLSIISETATQSISIQPLAVHLVTIMQNIIVGQKKESKFLVLFLSLVVQIATIMQNIIVGQSF